ncbi:hypothetical protein AZ09_11620 [Acetobacter aceti 1023]|nr:hypothetical protein AZ09_11620 [Acetobacter aceti 1023]
MLHLIKLAVGVESLDDLAERLKQPFNTRAHPDHASPLPVVHTRSFPKQKDALLDGGSLYRVINGLILCRQPILDIQSTTRSDGTQGTLILLSPSIIPVQPRAMRPFQGWRYLQNQDAPADLKDAATQPVSLPLSLQKKLLELGL